MARQVAPALLYGSLVAACAPAPRVAAVAPPPPPPPASATRETATRVAKIPLAPPIAVEVVKTRATSSQCPPEMVLVRGRTCVDRWEASLVVVDPDGGSRPWSPHVAPAGASVRAASSAAGTPQAYIDGASAARACRAAGKRLCTSNEWVTTCRGPDDTNYPYGAEHAAGFCNDDGRSRHPVADVTRRFGLDPARRWHENMQSPEINRLADTVEPSGHHARCTNDFGAFDMVGNLHEWVDDPDGTFRGGFYMDTRINGEGCLYATTAHGPDYRDYSTGFRCCQDPIARD
ncbi:MAG: SUMF1/EgtB/PvdO family nonheme iron enzyme [Myxococcota bacterium]